MKIPFSFEEIEVACDQSNYSSVYRPGTNHDWEI